jgi:hypothetical protein
LPLPFAGNLGPEDPDFLPAAGKIGLPFAITSLTFVSSSSQASELVDGSEEVVVS